MRFDAELGNYVSVDAHDREAASSSDKETKNTGESKRGKALSAMELTPGVLAGAAGVCVLGVLLVVAASIARQRSRSFS